MAITVARVHLAMAHASLPGLLPTPPTCTMLPLLPAPPCAILLPNSSSPPRPSRADAAGRWDAHKIKPAGTTAASSSSSSSSGGQHSLDINWKIVTSSRTSSDKNSNSRADSEERWDAHKRPASPASSSSSSSFTASSNKAKTCHTSRRPNGRASSSSSERWDAHKKPRAPPPADEIDDGESSTGSNDVAELDMPRPPVPPRSLYYAGPSFIRLPEPSMLPMPSFCRIRVA